MSDDYTVPRQALAKYKLVVSCLECGAPTELPLPARKVRRSATSWLDLFLDVLEAQGWALADSEDEEGAPVTCIICGECADKVMARDEEDPFEEE